MVGPHERLESSRAPAQDVGAPHQLHTGEPVIHRRGASPGGPTTDYDWFWPGIKGGGYHVGCVGRVTVSGGRIRDWDGRDVGGEKLVEALDVRVTG